MNRKQGAVSYNILYANVKFMKMLNWRAIFLLDSCVLPSINAAITKTKKPNSLCLILPTQYLLLSHTSIILYLTCLTFCFCGVFFLGTVLLLQDLFSIYYKTFTLLHIF